MKEINFITIGDKNYFSFIHFSIKKVLKFYPMSKLFIYDWGFTPFQKKKISTYPNTILIDWTDKIDRVSGYKTIRNLKRYVESGGTAPFIFVQREYLYNQKPFCMLDCAKRVKENLIYFDGDVILINPIDEIFEDNYDIGVTIIKTYKNISKELSYWKWGVNSGVIFFKLDSIKMQLFIQEWIKEIKNCKKGMMEQTSLNSLINSEDKDFLRKFYDVKTITLSNTEFKIKPFPASIYNFYRISEGYDDKKVKFLHLIIMKYYKPNLSKSIIIRSFIREIKIRYTFYNIIKLVSPILLPTIKRKFIRKFIFLSYPNQFREIFNFFLIFKFLLRPYGFKLIASFLLSVILNIRKKMK